MASASRPPPAPFLWRPAAQPDIVRAAQKDDLYLQQSVDAAHDVVRRVFGALPALQYSRETKLAATLAYHALTTGTGLQTLGEEYCDILQMTSGNTRLPPPALRTALVLLQSLGPYLADRLVASLERSGASAAMEGLHWEPSPSTSPRCQQEPSFRNWEPGDANSLQRLLSQALQSHRTPWRQRLAAAWHSALVMLSGSWPEAKPWMTFLTRVHLAAFYLAGTYYSWTKRVTRVTYTSVSAIPDRRASYRVLGLLLVAQLAISAALQAQPRLSALRKSASQRTLMQLEQQQQHAVVLEEVQQQQQEDDPLAHGETTSDKASSSNRGGYSGGQRGGLVVEQAASGVASSITGPSSGRNCPLCLSPRSSPTCTPCGHVFCWQCVAQWCAAKPECPLCRAPAAPSQLVCVAGGGF